MSLGVSRLWAWAGLVGLIAALLLAQRLPIVRRGFRWLPVPLWCYLLPLLAISLGWLPHEDAAHAIYRPVADHLLPVALALLLIGVDPSAVWRTGKPALLAAGVGAAGIVVGTVGWTWLLRAWLPEGAWAGAGLLAATWTGGTMNLLAMRALLNPPEAVFAPLVIVDPIIAYGWMAGLVALSARQGAIDRWLGAELRAPIDATTPEQASAQRPDVKALIMVLGLAGAVALAARWLGPRLPTGALVTSAQGWVVLLVTTTALCVSSVPGLRRLGRGGAGVGYFCLYLVLAAAGAQASLDALGSAPVWLALGAAVALTHGLAMVLAGKLWRLPLALLATASQANIGGVVSAPLVGATYHQSLAAVGLLLAVAGNALGTYLGWLAALLARWLLHAG